MFGNQGGRANERQVNVLLSSQSPWKTFKYMSNE